MRVEADGRLVHDDDGRLGEDGLGDADPLAVAFGELADDLVANALEVAELEHLINARAEHAALDLLQPPAEIEVFRHPHVLGQRIVLGHVADLALDLVGLRRDGHAADADAPGRGRQVAGEDAHRGGLAGAVGAEEAENFAPGHLEGDVIDRGDAGVGFDQVGNIDGGRIGHQRKG